MACCPGVSHYQLRALRIPIDSDYKSEIEFWSGKASRLHDRQRYLRQEDGEWKVDCLAP